MKLKLCIISLLSLIGLGVNAQTDWLQTPLQFVPASQVMTWNYGEMGFAEKALKADPDAKVNNITITDEIWNSRDKVAETWKTLQPQQNVVGGGGNELTEKQGLPAMMGVAANAYMWLMTGNVRHTDFIERSIYNAAMRTIDDPTLKKESQDLKGAAEILASLNGWIYGKTADEKELYVNLYTNCTANLVMKRAKFTLDQITSMPMNGQIKFRFSQVKRPFKMKVHLRIPDWMVLRNTPGNAYSFADGEKPEYQVFVNGHEVNDLTPDKKGYLTLDREWMQLDEIFILFPMPPHYLYKTDAKTGKALRGEVALQAGPQVYMVTTPARYCSFSIKQLPSFTSQLSDKGNDKLVGTMYRYSKKSSRGGRTHKMTYEAVPYSEGGKGLLWGREKK